MLRYKIIDCFILSDIGLSACGTDNIIKITNKLNVLSVHKYEGLFIQLNTTLLILYNHYVYNANLHKNELFNLLLRCQ